MLEVLQELQFAVSALGKDRRGEGLHDLLDGHGLPGELVLCGAGPREQRQCGDSPDPTYQTRPKAPIPTGCKSTYLMHKKINKQRVSFVFKDRLALLSLRTLCVQGVVSK